VVTQLKEKGMILLIGAEKGGVGKSTIASNLAVHLAGQGVDVVLLDTDTQATCARFVERRNEAGLVPNIHCMQRTGDVAPALRDLIDPATIYLKYRTSLSHGFDGNDRHEIAAA
jgi:cellulose biosynthesis protein BcsQ